MAGLYVGATAGYSGKNMVVMGLGLRLQKEGYSVGYLKPVGAMPREIDGRMWDDDAYHVQRILRTDEEPETLTPVIASHDFQVRAFRNQTGDVMESIRAAYDKVAAGKDVTIVGGSGGMHTGKYCNADGVRVVRELGLKAVVIDRYSKELNYDYLLVLKEQLGDHLAGVILNDVAQNFLDETQTLIAPFLRDRGIRVLGVIPKDPLMGAIKVSDLADRLGGKVISAHHKSDRIVESFLIGTMQVENFMTHFRRQKNSAIIVGGDRSDVHLVALEGDSPCLVLTGNLYPNDIILTRSEVLEIPIIVVREDTYTVAKKMETLLMRHKLRDEIKIRQGAQLINANLDFPVLMDQLGLRR